MFVCAQVNFTETALKSVSDILTREVSLKIIENIIIAFFQSVGGVREMVGVARVGDLSKVGGGRGCV